MIEKKLKWFGESGLHARPAGQLVSRSIEFESKITFINCSNDREGDGKGIFSLLTMELQKDTDFILRVDGYDEKEAMKSLLQLMVNHEFIAETPDFGIKRIKPADPEPLKNTLLPSYITESKIYKRYMRQK